MNDTIPLNNRLEFRTYDYFRQQMSISASPYLNSRSKRALDLGFSVLIAPFALIAFTLGVVLVYITSGGAVLFRQERVGRDGMRFAVVKIRTLSLRFESAPGALHDANDITWIGKLLRKTRIDEIPQILTIIKGDMSWVGPRPEVPFYNDQFQLKESRFENRLKAKPGITGLAQIYKPNAAPTENLEKLEHDLKYIESASLALDLKILVKSFLVIWKA